MEEVKGVYKSLGETIHSDFARIYDQAVRISDKVDVTAARQRTAARMQNRHKCPSHKCTGVQQLVECWVDHFSTLLSSQLTSDDSIDMELPCAGSFGYPNDILDVPFEFECLLLKCNKSGCANCLQPEHLKY